MFPDERRSKTQPSAEKSWIRVPSEPSWGTNGVPLPELGKPESKGDSTKAMFCEGCVRNDLNVTTGEVGGEPLEDDVNPAEFQEERACSNRWVSAKGLSRSSLSKECRLNRMRDGKLSGRRALFRRRTSFKCPVRSQIEGCCNSASLSCLRTTRPKL